MRETAEKGRRDPRKPVLVILTLLTVGQVAATHFVPRSFSLSVINDTLEFLFISSAVFVFLLNASVTTKQVRLFWTFLAASWGTRLVVQVMWMYFELVLRREAPNPFVGDILLFLCNIPVLAALLLQPALDQLERRKSTSLIDFLLLLLWWLYLYLFFVIPWQYIVPDEAHYGGSYNVLAGFLDAALLLALGFEWAHRSGRRRWFYTVFIGSQLLLALGAYLANRGIDQHMYYPGSWYDLPYSIALASATVVGLIGYGLMPDDAQRGRPMPLIQLGVGAVLSLPVITLWTFLTSNAPPPVARFREFVAQGTVFAMASLLFARQRQLRAELARANQVLQEASLTDPLTGARNRRFFDETIPSDTSHAIRSHASVRPTSGRDLIFYMVDLDCFKEVNDRHGHQAGDQVLKQVTNRIATVTRSSDILVRWGGDEFLIVSRYADRKEADLFASRILNAIGGSNIPISLDGITVQQTCSIGWAAFPWYPSEPDGVSMEAVLSLADRAVYEAKATGGNRGVGVLPCKEGHQGFIAVAGDNSAEYTVQVTCVLGPALTGHIVVAG